MISKLCALWLVVIVVSPFTAPFSTCDLASPLRHTRRGLPSVLQTAAAARVDTNAALVPARVNAGRPKLVARIGHRERTGPVSSVNNAHVADSLAVVQSEYTLHTVLRL